jgi:hypothetical protein
MQVLMKKEELLAVLEKNKAEHVAIFNEAVEGYKKSVVAAIVRVEKKWNETNELDVSILHLAQPQSYETQYEEAIEMVKFTQEPVITLGQTEFRQYVLDKWSWMGSFGATSSGYVSPDTVTALNTKTR